MNPADRSLIFDSDFLDDLAHWVATDHKPARRILEWIQAVRSRDPFTGIGKPEPLRHPGQSIWSRRITQEHRLVYRMQDARILFAQTRDHY